MKIFLVGGAVRDRLLGLVPTERDWVVVGGTPADLSALGYRPVGKDFPVFLHPATGEQYALARTERKTGPGYYGFETRFSPDVTLEDDLARRDLTVNAMAEDGDGRLVDPYGGRRDLEARVLRHVSPAFVEDPLRVLRVARFAARYARLGFTVAGETMDLMSRIAGSGELSALAPERVWAETGRALGEPTPAVYFEVLRRCGALAALFPEVAALDGVPQPPQWHPEVDTYVHALEVLDVAAELTPDTTVRWAALVHDVGKGTTAREEWPRHVGHEERGARLIEAMSERLRVPNEHRDLAVLAARLHGRVHRAAELRPGTMLELLEAADAFRRGERFGRLLLVCEADARGRGTDLRGRPYPQATRMRRVREAAAAARLDPRHAGEPGPVVAERMRAARIDAIRAAIAD
ncbi:MAG: multifunctional CCA addition/repair protein [Steroidobacteraceae bacterium]